MCFSLTNAICAASIPIPPGSTTISIHTAILQCTLIYYTSNTVEWLITLTVAYICEVMGFYMRQTHLLACFNPFSVTTIVMLWLMPEPSCRDGENYVYVYSLSLSPSCPDTAMYTYTFNIATPTSLFVVMEWLLLWNNYTETRQHNKPM